MPDSQQVDQNQTLSQRKKQNGTTSPTTSASSSRKGSKKKQSASNTVQGRAVTPTSTGVNVDNAPAAGAAGEGEGEGWFGGMAMRLLQYALIMYLLKTAFGTKSSPTTTTTNTTTSSTTATNDVTSAISSEPTNLSSPSIPQQQESVLHNLWRDGSNLELEVFLSTVGGYTIPTNHLFSFIEQEYTDGDDGDDIKHNNDNNAIVDTTNSPPPRNFYRVYRKIIPYIWDVSEDITKVEDITITDESFAYITNALRHNQTIYAHSRFTVQGYSKSPAAENFRPFGSVIRSTEITEYKPPPKLRKVKNLLAGVDTENVEDVENLQEADDKTENIIPSSASSVSSTSTDIFSENDIIDTRYVIHWKPAVSLRLVYDFTPIVNYAFHPEIARSYNVYPYVNGYICPIVYDEFWSLKEDSVLVDTRTTTLKSAKQGFNLKRKQLQKKIKEQDMKNEGITHSAHSAHSTQTNESNGALQIQADLVTTLKTLENSLFVNNTIPTLPLQISYSPTSITRLVIMQSLQRSFEMQTQQGVGGLSLSDGREIDEIKRMLRDTNPILLAITVFVTIIHSVFDYLAFSSDVSFWKQQKSVVGLSVRALFLNAISQLIIFFYLLDNETSWTILISTGIGAIIECWKITKATDITCSFSYPFLHIAEREEYKDSETSEFDKEAFRYLTYAVIPIILGYSIYNVIYSEYKSWYSWILSSLTSAIYGFGFISMCPQLYLNYKLQSVAHLPWKMLTYKALNTFVDDLFAFVVKMPTLHRIACFRDDIVFFIFLYQKWKYRTDYTRANEFGLSFEDQKEEEKGVSESEKSIKDKTDDEVGEVKDVDNKADKDVNGEDDDSEDEDDEDEDEDIEEEKSRESPNSSEIDPDNTNDDNENDNDEASNALRSRKNATTSTATTTTSPVDDID